MTIIPYIYTKKETKKLTKKTNKMKNLLKTPTKKTGNQKEYSWEQINAALTGVGIPPRNILKIISALNK